ncbi:TPA: hypothetical protein L4718_002519 [Pseudomonas aeruginosa]|uniref:hypothetical protein n=1 Tax=Ectopseudomonas khazarica TaxID=2502979 RepID=UPI00099813C4|nr:hypothetical protein BZY60_000355 [Pseudomonas aeruginosa]HBO5745732.1 hypothetical protein [Pseudomonas aeruginosa]HBO5782047.1 hypothetical protein [Pseudomonas aeruginosa]HBO6016735.1 hypothetical protein [Pseudomonas aeruginosa]HBO6023218.1 hypothetical protein [Pseudomonas aeruginosa]
MGEVIDFPLKASHYDQVEKYILEILTPDTGLTGDQVREVVAEFKPIYERLLSDDGAQVEMPVEAIPYFEKARDIQMERLGYAACVIIGLLARAKLHKP